jgi:hypothetical protein
MMRAAAAAAMQLSDSSIPLPPSIHIFRPASPESKFPSLLDMRGNKDEEGLYRKLMNNL